MTQEDTEYKYRELDSAIDLNDAVSCQYSAAKTFREILSFSQNDIEAFHQAASELLNEKKANEAADAFLFLATLEPDCYENWMHLGAAEQLRETYPLALEAYAMAVLNKPQEPAPHIEAAICYAHSHDFDRALHSLNLAYDCAVANPIYNKVQENIRKLKTSFISQYKKQKKSQPQTDEQKG